MAHFSTLVIGENPEERLRSFSILSRHYDSEINGKFDWCQLGGAWDGHLLLHDGKKVNQAFKKEIQLPIIPTFAVLHHGTWHQLGNLTAWEPSKTMKPTFVWHREFQKLIDSAHDDALFSIYDCHI